MMLKNTAKLTFANASNIWKLLLYRIICLLCVLGLTTIIAWPIINTLIKENFFVNLQTSFEKMLFNLNFEDLFLTIDKTFKNFADIISANNYVVWAILCFALDLILFTFLEGYASLSIYENVNGYMGSLTKYGFTNSYVSNFGKATLQNLASLITTLPINLIIWFGAYFLASSLYEKVGVFAIIMILFLLIVLVALKDTFFSGWKSALVIHNEPVFKSLKMGVKAVSRRFFRTFASYLILVAFIFAINVFSITLLAGVGLFVTLPLSTILCIIFNQVMYYESLGMRYYVDSEHIISPKRLEEQDRFAKVKDII